MKWESETLVKRLLATWKFFMSLYEVWLTEKRWKEKPLSSELQKVERNETSSSFKTLWDRPGIDMSRDLLYRLQEVKF